ncbi:MAG: peptide/nickel transport system permease protein [Gaiellales bacterium]|jgi:peptide/nickel transport system permease protein|nr:peptide/nickel transport system permease protein [Gaiellales bacterium]
MTTVAGHAVPMRGSSPVMRFLGRRIAGAILALFAASIVIFAGTVLLPGDAAGVVLGKNATPENVARLNHQMGLDKPAHTEYVNWLTGLAHGDLGDSAVGLAQGAPHAPIWPLISGPVKNSVILALIAALLMIPLSLGLGGLAAVYAGRPIDHLISIGSLAAIALPEFVIGSLLVGVFFVGLNLLPPVAIVPPGDDPLSHPTKLVLPVATLLLASLAAGIRMVRAGMVEVLQTEYVQTARLNGLAEKRVLLGYAMRNALAPSIQVLAQNLQWLIGGIIITESVFAYPGIGTTLVSAVGNRDVTVVQTVAMLIAVVYVALNLVADLLVMLLVPKLREPS